MRLGIFFSLLFITQLGTAQSGWDFIKSNDYRKAKTTFREKLAKDTSDLEAITGMIYLAEVTGDDLSYDKILSKYFHEHLTPELYSIYGSEVVFNASRVQKDRLDFKVLEIEKGLLKSSEYKLTNKFTEAQQTLEDHISHLNWSMIGPFSSNNGYGFVKEYRPELDKYVADTSYRNLKNQELYWFQPEYTNPTGALMFSDHLLEDRYGSVYYANTFLKLDQETSLELRLRRKYPIKIWVDDHLVYEDKEVINPSWDGEKIGLQLERGTHRLLIKYVIGNVRERFDRYRDTDWGEGFGYEKYMTAAYNNNYSARYLPSIKSGLEGLVLRVTDSEGKLIPIKTTSEAQEYLRSKPSYTIQSKSTIKYVEQQLQDNPSDWFRYYELIKANENHGNTKNLEKTLVQALKKHPESVYFKYLLSKVYLSNGKREKSYGVLSNVDLMKTPIFSVLYKNLNEIDSENQPQRYEATLKEMLQTAPSNYKVISLLLDYYKAQGMDDEKKEFAHDIKEKYPTYAYHMKSYLKDNNKPTDYDIGDKKQKKQIDKRNKAYRDKKGNKTRKRLKKNYSRNDYEYLIRLNKQIDNADRVLELYDQLIAINPHMMNYRRDKAEYLYNKDRNKEAIQVLKTILKTTPYDQNIYEMIGDIYKDANDDTLALDFYLKAERVNPGARGAVYGGWNSYGGEQLQQKITRIQGQKQLKNKFITPDVSDWLADTTWQEKYKDEESVVVGFTNEIMVDKDGYGHLWGKAMIKILTEAGANSWTEYNFYQLGSIDYVKVIKPDGAEIYPEYQGTFVVFKNLAPGDIIVLEGSYDWALGGELPGELVYFQRMMFHAPLHYSQFSVALPEEKHLRYQHYHLENTLEQRSADGFQFYTWEYHDLDKVKPEEGALDEMDIYATIMISTIKNWQPIVDWYQAKTYRKLEPNYEIEQIMDTIIKPTMSDKEKVIAVYNWITQEINYSFTSLLQSDYIPKSTEHTCSSKIGDCKDVATLMISMLKLVDIEAHYVLVKTNSYFHQEILPSTFFDHVITGIDMGDTTWYVDLTTDFYPYYVTSDIDIGAWALEIKDHSKGLFQLDYDYTNPRKNLIRHDLNCVLKADRSLQIEVRSSHAGLVGGRLRETIHRKTQDDLKNEIFDYMGVGTFNNLEILDFDYLNPNDITDTLRSNYSFVADEYSDEVLDIKFFKIPWMIGIQKHQALLSDQRANTLDLQQITEIAPTHQTIRIEYPKSMQLRFLPQDIALNNEFGVYQLSFKRGKNSIIIEKYQEFKKHHIAPGDFQRFKEYYQKVLRYDNMKIVFR